MKDLETGNGGTGRISPEEINAIKQRVDVEHLLQDLGIEYKKTKSGLNLLCPFHDDTDPSLFFNHKRKITTKKIWNKKETRGVIKNREHRKTFARMHDNKTNKKHAGDGLTGILVKQKAKWPTPAGVAQPGTQRVNKQPAEKSLPLFRL